MHDTFLFENIANSVYDLCKENNISKLTYMKVSVFRDSHINGKALYKYLKDKNHSFIGEFTKLVVEYNNPEQLTAIIQVIEGE